jgi:hypothetical protein
MGPSSYMRSVVDPNVVMWRIPVLQTPKAIQGGQRNKGHNTQDDPGNLCLLANIEEFWKCSSLQALLTFIYTSENRHFRQILIYVTRAESPHAPGTVSIVRIMDHQDWG